MNEKINQWLAFIDDYDREMVKVAEEKNEKLKKAMQAKNYIAFELFLKFTNHSQLNQNKIKELFHIICYH